MSILCITIFSCASLLRKYKVLFIIFTQNIGPTVWKCVSRYLMEPCQSNPIQSNPIQSDLNTMKMSVFENTYCKHSYVNIKKLKKQCTSRAQTINNVTQTILCSKCVYQFGLLRRFNLVDIKAKVNYAGIYSFTRRQLRLRNIVTKHLVRIIMKSFKLKIRVI